MLSRSSDSAGAQSGNSDSEPCTCTFGPVIHYAAAAKGHRYAIYLDRWEDPTEFDPACPYHGENGSMVVTVKVRAVHRQDPAV